MKFISSFSKVNQFGIINSMISFVLGSLILLAYLISQVDVLISAGMYYLLIAFYWNLAVITMILIAMLYRKTRKESLSTIGLMLINIPIAFIYFLIVIQFVK